MVTRWVSLILGTGCDDVRPAFYCAEADARYIFFAVGTAVCCFHDRPVYIYIYIYSDVSCSCHTHSYVCRNEILGTTVCRTDVGEMGQFQTHRPTSCRVAVF